MNPRTKGWVYIASIEGFSKRRKIGFTEYDHPQKRIDEWDTTGTPGPPILEYAAGVSCPPQPLEALIHRDISGRRNRANREWFDISLDDAIYSIKKIASDHIVEEYDVLKEAEAAEKRLALEREKERAEEYRKRTEEARLEIARKEQARKEEALKERERQRDLERKRRADRINERAEELLARALNLREPTENELVALWKTNDRFLLIALIACAGFSFITASGLGAVAAVVCAIWYWIRYFQLKNEINDLGERPTVREFVERATKEIEWEEKQNTRDDSSEAESSNAVTKEAVSYRDIPTQQTRDDSSVTIDTDEIKQPTEDSSFVSLASTRPNVSKKPAIIKPFRLKEAGSYGEGRCDRCGEKQPLSPNQSGDVICRKCGTRFFALQNVMRPRDTSRKVSKNEPISYRDISSAAGEENERVTRQCVKCGKKHALPRNGSGYVTCQGCGARFFTKT